MDVDITGRIAHLTGNWTRSEMTDSNIDLLACSLKKLRGAGMRNVRIDCGQLNEVDVSGLQVLYIWLRSFKFRGIDLEMVNPPRKLRKVLQGLLIKICYSEEAINNRMPYRR